MIFFFDDTHDAQTFGPPALDWQYGMIYLSGPMTGIKDFNFPAFHAEAGRLRALGHKVINPAEINTDQPLSWGECLRADIRLLCGCDTPAYLPNWESSSGVHLEMSIAHRLKITIVASDRIK
jgi:hypothetical protein